MRKRAVHRSAMVPTKLNREIHSGPEVAPQLDFGWERQCKLELIFVATLAVVAAQTLYLADTKTL